MTPAVVALAAGRRRRRGSSVHRRPRVAVLATGDEVRAPGADARRRPASPTRTGPGLAALVDAAGGDADRPRASRPTTSTTSWRGSGAASPRAPTRSSSSGGVSVGPYDVVKTAFEAIGHDRPVAGRGPARQAVRVRDAPTARAAATPVLLFGLPGNPVSCVRDVRAVRPARRSGAWPAAATSSGRSTGPSSASRSPRATAGAAFLRVAAERDADGRADPRRAGPRPRATSAGGQGSHVISALAAADALAVIPEARRRAAGRRRGRAVVARPGMMPATRPTDPTDPEEPMDRRPAAARRAPPADPRRPSGRPRMVDVSAKPVDGPARRRRGARSPCRAETLSLVIDGGGPKGDVLAVAELAGVMGGKRTERADPAVPPARR